MNEPMEVAFAPDRLAVLLRHFAELNDERESGALPTVCTENSSSGVVVMKSAQDGA